MAFLSFIFGSIFYLFYATPAFAHEAYVLTNKEFQEGLKITSPNPLAPLFDTSHLQISVIITIFVVLSYFFVILFSTTSIASYLDKMIRKAKEIGPLIIRIAISFSFFYAAMANSIFAPELSLAQIPYGHVLRTILFALSILIFFGFFTEIAALVGIIIYLYVATFFGPYIITYANYFGELIALFLFGSIFLSIDKYLFGKKLLIQKFSQWKEFETPIVRILYGIALIYAGWTIKFEHQSLSIAVYNQYHLINFFKANPQFIAAGAGLSEIAIGFFILIGFAQRFTVLISLFFITLSIFYFKEMLWPHFMLYGISFSILINSCDKFTIDRYMIPFVRNILHNKRK